MPRLEVGDDRRALLVGEQAIEAGSGDEHPRGVECALIRKMRAQIRRVGSLGGEELVREAKELGAPLDLVSAVARSGRLPVPSFAAGGIATPADAALCMALGAEAVFVGSGIFLSADAPRRARAIVTAVTCWEDPRKLAEVSTGLGAAMRSIDVGSLAEHERFAGRGA